MPDASARHLVAFRPKQLALQLQIGVAAERPARGDHTVTRDGRIAALAHDRSDRSPRARRAGDLRDIAVGGEASAGNPTDRGHHAPRELGGGRKCPRPAQEITGQ